MNDRCPDQVLFIACTLFISIAWTTLSPSPSYPLALPTPRYIPVPFFPRYQPSAASLLARETTPWQAFRFLRGLCWPALWAPGHSLGYARLKPSAQSSERSAYPGRIRGRGSLYGPDGGSSKHNARGRAAVRRKFIATGSESIAPRRDSCGTLVVPGEESASRRTRSRPRETREHLYSH